MFASFFLLMLLSIFLVQVLHNSSKDYNVNSPLNAQAALWAKANKHLLPIGNLDLYQNDLEIKLADSRDDDIDILLGPS